MSTFTILYSRRFDRDFGSILRYLRKEVSDLAADKIRDRVFEAIEILAENPEFYPPEPRLADFGNYRVIRLRKAPYKIFYKVGKTEVRIERIFYSRRDFDRIFKRFKF